MKNQFTNPQCNCSKFEALIHNKHCFDSDKIRLILSSAMSKYGSNKSIFEDIKLRQDNPIITNIVSSKTTPFSLLFYQQNQNYLLSNIYMFNINYLIENIDSSIYGLEYEFIKHPDFEFISNCIYISENTKNIYDYSLTYGIAPRPPKEYIDYAMTVFKVKTDSIEKIYYATIPHVKKYCNEL
jgi:hypothetical protein